MLFLRKKPFEQDAVNPKLSRGAVPAGCWEPWAGTGRTGGTGVSGELSTPRMVPGGDQQPGKAPVSCTALCTSWHWAGNACARTMCPVTCVVVFEPQSPACSLLVGNISVPPVWLPGWRQLWGCTWGWGDVWSWQMHGTRESTQIWGCTELGSVFKMTFEFGKAPSSCVLKQHPGVCSGAAGAGEREFTPCHVQI